jgi:hypothetical protein
MSYRCGKKRGLIFQLNWNSQAGALASALTDWEGRAASEAGVGWFARGGRRG